MPSDLLTDEQVGLTGELSDGDVGLNVAPPQIKLSPYDQLRMAGAMPAQVGATSGPANPQEVLDLPKLAQIPGLVLGEATRTAGDLFSDFLNRTGIDPSAMPGRNIVDTGPLPITNIPGTPVSPLKAIAPEFAQGIERKAGEFLSGFTEPGQAALMAVAPESKLVQGLFATQAASQLPESIQTLSRARTPEELGAALMGTSADVAMAYLLGRGALGREAPERIAPTQGPLAEGSVLPTPRGAPRPVQEPPPTIQTVAADAAASAAKAMTDEATASYDPKRFPTPRRGEPLVVPEGPSDPRVDQAREAGADTVSKVLQLFPEMKGNRTSARIILKQSFPEKESSPVVTPDQPSPVGPSPEQSTHPAPFQLTETPGITPVEAQAVETPPTTPAPAPTPTVRGPATTADILGKVNERLTDAAEAARARLTAKRRKGVGGEFNLGPFGELENIKDFAIIGAAKIAKGSTEFARWAAEMVKEFGEGIKPHLENIFPRSQQAFDDHTSVVTRVNRVLYEAGLPRRSVAEAGKRSVGKSIEAGVEAGRNIAEAEAAPKLASLQDQLSDSIPKAQALREYFAGQEEGGAAGRKTATEELKLADKWLEADARRIRDSLIAFANASLPVAERGRFLKAIADATKRPPLLTGDPEAMYRRAAAVAARIEDRATDVRKSGVATEIKEAVTNALQSPGVDISYKKRILDAVKRVTFTKPLEATTDALKSTRDYLARQQAAGKDVTMPKDVLDELELLGKVPAKELPEHVLEAIRDKVNLLDKLGRLKVNARKQAWEIEKNDKLKQLSNEATNPVQARPEFRQQPGDPRPLSTKIRNWVNRQLNMGALLDKALLPIDALFDLLGDAKGTYRGWLFRNVRNPLDLDFNAAQVMRDTKTAPLEAIIKEHNLGERESERIGVYAAALQEGGIERLVEMGVKPESIDGILKSITPAEMRAYLAMRTAMDSTLPDVQKLMHELYNIDVKPVPNYFPMPRDWNLFEPEPKPLAEPKYGQEMNFDELSGWKQMLGDFSAPKTTKTERGFTIAREKGATTPIKLNAFDVFFQHMNDVSYLLKTQRDLKMIGEMARDDLFQSKYGNIGRNIVTSWLDTVARQGRIGGFRRIPMLDELRRRTSTGVIGFRLASQFVHLSNIPLAVWRAGGPMWWKAGLGESLSERGQGFLHANFTETFTRGGGEPALVEASQSGLSVFGKQAIPKAVVRAGFAVARKIDQMNAQATTLGIYLRLLNEKGLDAKNYDKLPVDKEAQAQALVLSRRAVASPLPKDVSASLSRGAVTGGNISLGRTIFQFQNIFQDQWSNIRHDLARAGIREKNPKLAATAFVSLAAMLLAEMGIRESSKQAIDVLTGHTPKKEISAGERIALEACRRIPFGGQVSNQILYGQTGVPVIDSILDTEKAVKTAATAKKEATQSKALVRAVSGAAQLGGVPGASQVGELIQKAQ